MSIVREDRDPELSVQPETHQSEATVASGSLAFSIFGPKWPQSAFQGPACFGQVHANGSENNVHC